MKNETETPPIMFPPCPDCGGETFRDEGRVTWCRDCGWNLLPPSNTMSSIIDHIEGRWTKHDCPQCGARLLANWEGDLWCSFTQCTYAWIPLPPAEIIGSPSDVKF